MKAFLFNPENDLALSVGTANYTPPRNAALLHRCGALLPLWYADEGDRVLATDTDSEWIETQVDRFGIKAISTPMLPEKIECCPWGWSENAAWQFHNAGVATASLPSSTQLNVMRQLSHRRITIDVYRQLTDVNGINLTSPVEAMTIEDIKNYSTRHPDGFYFKSPWSSTGRGVALSSLMTCDEVIKRCKGIIERQGSVMLEPALDRRLDFAMLFTATNGVVSHYGYSLFNNSGNAYSGNILISDEKIKQLICETTNNETIHCLEETMPQILTEIIGKGYTGYFGVDMMVYRDNRDGTMKIAPCVEINLRMTMGIVAHIWRDRHLAPGVSATMSISFGKTGDIIDNAVIEDQRLVAGKIHLVPPGRGFDFTIVVK